MTVRMQHIKKHLLSACALAITNSLLIGCRYFPESTFELSKDSRLPRWVTVPPELTRAGVKLTMSYYIKPWGSSAVFSLQNESKQVVEKVAANVVCREPFHLAKSTRGSAFSYPAYEAIRVNGITEITEHRRMEPIFYVTDDPAVWKQYRASGCS